MTVYVDAKNVPLAAAVFLVFDDYDYNPDAKTVSATTLIKPVRQVALAARMPAEAKQVSLYSRLKSRMGQALHREIERCWRESHQALLRELGYPESFIKRVVVNPEHVEPGQIPVYLEQRSYKEVDGWRVSGKFDFVLDGTLEDFKFTSTFTYSTQVKADDYVAQMSIYRWLNPTIITNDVCHINMFFWDWSAAKARYTKDYPPLPIMQQTFKLWSLEETERYIRARLNVLQAAFSAPTMQDIPLCTKEDLWIRSSKYKYFANPAKASADSRATRTFDSREEALNYQMTKGGKGVVIEAPGKAKACNYCIASTVCDQYKRLKAAGLIDGE